MIYRIQGFYYSKIILDGKNIEFVWQGRYMQDKNDSAMFSQKKIFNCGR